MITYFYWFAVLALTFGAVYLFGARFNSVRGAVISAALILLTGWAAHYFYFEQVFVKRWGGVMSIRVPEGHQHIGLTWKDDNLWVENYDPASDTCTFSEYSKGNLLQGKVTVKRCNPVGYRPVTGRVPAAMPAPPTE